MAHAIRLKQDSIAKNVQTQAWGNPGTALKVQETTQKAASKT